MNAAEIGKQLVAYCKAGENLKSIETLYADDVVSVEAAAPTAGGDRETRGIAGVKAKNTWWVENHEVHSASTEGPYPHGDDRFAVRFSYDMTNKPSGRRMQLDEIGVFTVANGKVVREEFYYSMG
jgi:ketosteroid isomerase-like protein